MSKLVKKMEDGQKAYLGFLSPEEQGEADKLLEYLEKEVPNIEEALKQKYNNRNIYYAHEFGTKLKEIMEQFEIKGGMQEKIFWDEVRDFASKDEDRPQDRNDGRKLYDYYYRLAQYDINDIKDINWSEWSQLFDVDLSRDNRIVEWMISKSQETKINRHLFRELLPGIRIYMKNKDTQVFTNEQLYEKLNMVFKVSKARLELHNKYFEEDKRELTEARRKKKVKYREKYFTEVFKNLKKQKEKSLEEVCDEVFRETYYVK